MHTCYVLFVTIFKVYSIIITFSPKINLKKKLSNLIFNILQLIIRMVNLTIIYT